MSCLGIRRFTRYTSGVGGEGGVWEEGSSFDSHLSPVGASLLYLLNSCFGGPHLNVIHIISLYCYIIPCNSWKNMRHNLFVKL